MHKIYVDIQIIYKIRVNQLYVISKASSQQQTNYELNF